MSSNEALLLDVKEAAERLSIGRAMAWEMVASGELPTVRIGRRRLVPAEALRRYVESLEAEAAQTG